MLRISIDPHWSTQHKTTEVLRSTNLNQRLSFHQIPDWIWHLHTFSKGPMQGQRLPSDPQKKKTRVAVKLTHHLSRSTYSQLHILPQSLEIWESCTVHRTLRQIFWWGFISNKVIVYHISVYIYKQMRFSPFQQGFLCILTRLTVLLSVLISISESVAIESSSSALHHCCQNTVAWLESFMVPWWMSGSTSKYMICILQQFLIVSACTNTYHVSTFLPGTDSTVVLDKENLSIKGVHSSIPKDQWCHRKQADHIHCNDHFWNDNTLGGSWNAAQ